MKPDEGSWSGRVERACRAVRNARKFIEEEITLSRCEPFRIARAIGHHEQCDYAKEHGGQAFNDKKPFPPGQSEPVRIEQQSRHRSTQGQTKRHGQD